MDIKTLDGALNLDKRVSRVVLVVGTGFAVRTKVSVMTDNTLVAVSHDGLLEVLRLLGTFTVTEDAGMLNVRYERSWGRLVNGSKSVAVVFASGSRLETPTAIVKVWADKALVADAVNVLVATVADRVMTNIAAGWEQ